MMAERKVSHSETIVTRVERLEKALGVNVYTTGSGRLDTLARDVRLSLAMIVEYQARAASDNLSAPLCLFPAREGDLSMISAAVMPVQPRSGSRRPSGDAHDGRRGSRETRRSWSSISMRTSDGDSGDSSGGGDGGGSGSTVWGGGGGGDVGRLWLAEDAGYLCVDLLLERTLEELAEGLAFAASHVEKGRSRSLAASRGSSGGGGGITGGGGSATSARASASQAAVDVAGAAAAAAAAAASTTSKPSSLPTERDGHQQEESGRGSTTTLKREIERMQDRCARLGALVARLRVVQQQQRDERGKGEGAGAWVQDGTGRRPSVVFAAEEQSEERGEVNDDAQRPTPESAVGVIAKEVLRLSCALAGDLQYLLSRPAYCRVLDAFAFTPGRKCLCGREFDTGGTAATIPLAPAAAAAAAATAAGGKNVDVDVGRGNGGDNGRDRDQRGGPRQQPRPQRQGQTHSTQGATEEKTHNDATGGGSGAGTGDRGGKGQQQRPPPMSWRMPTFMSVPLTTQNGGGRPSGEGIFVVAGEGALEKASGFRVRSTLYQASGCASRREQGQCCFVLSLGHLSSFLASARSRAAHRAVSSLTKELKRDVLAAELAARESVAAATAARAGAREASAEALEATARAAAAAASARNEGSLLLVEFHEQLANAMRTERDRLERDNYERARAERERVGQLLETQARKKKNYSLLGHLKSLLDGKAGQEDLASITRAMGDVEETLTVVRQSIPGEKALQELQEALARKADKAYTKRKMALLVSRVSALLQEESEEPSMAKKCLSCDRAFNKLSFKELELAHQQLPEVLESAEDAAMRAQQQQQRMAAGGAPGGRGLEGEGHATGDGPRETVADRSGSPPPGGRRDQANKRPGSAPSARSSTLEPRTFGNNRPSSAAPQRLVGGGGTSAVGGGFRPGSGGARSRTARGVGAHANSNSRLLPPATGGPQPTTRHSPLFAPAALSATYGLLSDGARKAVESEAFRAERVSAREPSPAPDHIRYGGMTQAPLVRQLFSGLGGGVGGVGGLDTPTSVDGAHGRAAVGNRIFKGGTRGRGGTEGRGRTGAGRGKGVEHLRVSGEGGGGAAAATADERTSAASGGDNHEGFASTLEHHRRNVIAVTVPPVQAVGAAGFVPETLIRGSGGGGGDGNNSKRGSKPYGA
ncbi:unnamed protein product [Ectocarpus fasciculatus]